MKALHIAHTRTHALQCLPHTLLYSILTFINVKIVAAPTTWESIWKDRPSKQTIQSLIQRHLGLLVKDVWMETSNKHSRTMQAHTFECIRALSLATQQNSFSFAVVVIEMWSFTSFFFLNGSIIFINMEFTNKVNSVLLKILTKFVENIFY